MNLYLALGSHTSKKEANHRKVTQTPPFLNLFFLFFILITPTHTFKTHLNFFPTPLLHQRKPKSPKPNRRAKESAVGVARRRVPLKAAPGLADGGCERLRLRGSRSAEHGFSRANSTLCCPLQTLGGGGRGAESRGGGMPAHTGLEGEQTAPHSAFVGDREGNVVDRRRSVFTREDQLMSPSLAGLPRGGRRRRRSPPGAFGIIQGGLCVGSGI